MLDINKLLDTATVILDPQESSPEGLVDILLDSMLDASETVTKSEVKSILFSDADNTCIAHSIQGRVEGEGGGTMADPSWLCIFADVPKHTKNSLQTARTFSTIFSDMQLRHSLLQSEDQLI